MTLLQVEELVSGYGNAEILHGVSLDVADGDVVTIIGPNGAGKSTVMKTIFGLTERFSGTIRFRGEDIHDVSPHEMVGHGISYVPQRGNVFPTLSVEENLKMGAYTLDGMPEETVASVIEMFPLLDERRDQRASTMSGGQQQMLAIGQALMVDPDLLLLDEPSAGLAPDLVDDVFEKVQEINATGKSILIVEQNAEDALRISDRGYVLEAGENRYEGTGEEILSNDEVIDLYLGGGNVGD